MKGADFIRLWNGPLPKTACIFTFFLRSWILDAYVILSTIEFVLRYQFICKWKCMRVMNDNLIVELSIICTTGATLWLSFAKFLSPGREFLPEVSKVEFFLKGRLDLIPSPSQKIQIMDGKVGLMCKGKTLLGVVNKLLNTKGLLTHPAMFCLVPLSKLSRQ